jgi:dihydrolipoamide dehydrogenase
MKEYDVVIIGGGPGGYVCAVRCRQLGLSTALIEKDELGGTCLNWGCIPTKALLRNAEVYETVREAPDYGIEPGKSGLRVDYSRAYSRSRQVSGRLVKGVGFLMNKNGVDVYRDSARIIDTRTVELEQSGTVVRGKKLVLAMGSNPVALPDVLVDGKKILNPKDALGLEELPDKTAVIGAGPIGMEFASIWRSYGVEVTVFELLDRVLPKEDADVSDAVTNRFDNRGIEVRTGARITDIDTGNPGSINGVELTFSDGKGASGTMKVDSVLFALGVKPVIGGNGLENLNLTLQGNGIKVNGSMETSEPGVFAIGDMTGLFPLAHVASEQGIIVAETIAGLETEPLDYNRIPRCTYCIPEVASIGLSEEEAGRTGKKVSAGTFPLYANGKALSLGDGEGFVKIVSDRGTGEILGVHMCGPHVTEMISGVSVAMQLECTVEELARAVHPHPTLSEAIKEAALAAAGSAIHI